MDVLKIAIVGCGTVHGVHIHAIEKIEGIKLYALCDIKKDKVMNLANQYGCKYFTNFKEMLEDPEIDAVHVCTPHYLHKPMTLEALNKGKHVFTEKPLGLSKKECEDIIREAKASDKKVSICLQNRLNPTSIVMKQIIESHQMGEMKGIRAFVSWHRDAAYYTSTDWRGRKIYEGGGLLMNQMIHTVDLMQWFCGGINELRGHVSNRLLEGVIDEEDTAEATFWMGNGAIGHFYATNCYTMDSSVLIEAHFEKGLLRINDATLTCMQNGEVKEITADRRGEKGKSYWGSSHGAAIAKFYKAIKEGTHDYIGVEEGAISVDICQSIYQSSNQNGETIHL